jgi:hypothetical protein
LIDRRGRGNARRDLAARVAVNTRIVNEEVACDVLRQSPHPVSHVPLFNLHNLRESCVNIMGLDQARAQIGFINHRRLSASASAI